MGTTLDDVKMTLDRIEAGMGDLLNRLVIDGSHIQTTHLSDINQSMGLILAGEFRTGQGDPGRGFSGVRMAWPPMVYNTDNWNIVGVANDVLQFGLSADDGKAYFGGGAGVLDSTGIYINAGGGAVYSPIRAYRIFDDVNSVDRFHIAAYKAGTSWETEIFSGYDDTGTAIDNRLNILSQSYGGEKATTWIRSVSNDGMIDTDAYIQLVSELDVSTVSTIYFKGLLDYALAEPANLTGWQTWIGTWTYASSSTFTVSGDKTLQFPVGTKIRITQTTDKYFVVTSRSYSAPNTTVTVTGGSDYSLVNAAITLPYYSYEDGPQGFPVTFTYAPSWTATGTAPDIGNGTLTGEFNISSNGVVHTWIFQSMGSTTTYGTGSYRWSLPVTSSNANFGGVLVYGVDQGTAYRVGNGALNTTTTFHIISETAGEWGQTVPHTWANTDVIKATVEYLI